jgi:hypothetical protein
LSTFASSKPSFQRASKRASFAGRMANIAHALRARSARFLSTPCEASDVGFSATRVVPRLVPRSRARLLHILEKLPFSHRRSLARPVGEVLVDALRGKGWSQGFFENLSLTTALELASLTVRFD